MKILDISVDGFGNFSGLQLNDLSETVSVLYGRNEAGKTTLLQFVRTMFYGLTPDRRHRYLPPRGDGVPGGSLRVKTPTGTYRVHRRLDATAGRDRFPEDHVSVVRCDQPGEEDHEQGGHALRVLLSGVDEQTYRNVYAVGLREMQELATLSDTDAARHLYDLSAGLDRVSLIDVLRQLKNSREQLLCGADPESEIFRLLERRDQLHDQLQRVRQSLGRYHNLTSERSRLSKQIAGLEEDRTDVEHRVRVAELASSLFPQWQQLQTVRQRLDELGAVPRILAEDVRQLDDLGEQIRLRQRALTKIKVQRQQRREQAATYPINEALRQHAARVDALAEQQDWIRSLDERIDQLDAEIQRRETALEEKRRPLGIDPELKVNTREDRAAIVSKLRGPAREMRQAKVRLQQYRRRAAESREAREADAEQLTSEMAARGTENLVGSVETAGNRVELLRQRVEADEQLERLELKQADLKEERDELIDRQVLPSWGLAASGFAFAFGIMLLLMGILTAIYGTGWPYILMGLALVGGVVITKLMFEHSAEMDLETCEHAMGKLDAKLKKARKARDELDAQIPPGGGPVTNQLRKAQQELAQLQSLVPLQDKQVESRQQAQTASRKASALREDYQQARKQWCRALHNVGLRANLSPQHAKEVLLSARQLARLQHLLERRREEARQRRRELSGCVERVRKIYEQLGLEPVNERLIDQVQQLGRASAEQQQWIERREGILKESHQLRRNQLTVSREVLKLQARRRTMLEQADAESPDEFRELAQSYAESVDLKDKRKRLKSQISTAISGVCQPQELAERMDGATAQQLERRWEKLTAKLEEVDQRLKEAFEKRGRLTEQLRTLADDRRGAQQQLELNSVEQQLRNATSRWQEFAVTSRLLQSIRRRYEQERQPATLREASQYFQQLTDGRYGRIWTLLDEDALCVDDRDGRSLTPENLSRGTREQLFLSLRMALVTQYAQRGVQLPLVLDDVFVNFDSHRARAAAGVLHEFASLGHQVLIFTCHEHILEIFGSVGSDTRRLPGESSAPVAPPAKPARRRKKKIAPAPAPEPKPVVETEPQPGPVAAEPTKEPDPQPIPVPAPEPAAVEPPPPEPVPPPPAPEPVATSGELLDDENTWEIDDEELHYAESASTLFKQTNEVPDQAPQDVSHHDPTQESDGNITEAA